MAVTSRAVRVVSYNVRRDRVVTPALTVVGLKVAAIQVVA
jgi:hypothetical protein